MPRLLIVSPHFPPINAPDMQRIRTSLPEYRRLGWEPIVLAVRPGSVAAVQEPELNDTLPSDLAVHRCDAWSTKWTRWLGLGTLGLRCWWSLYLAGRRILASGRCDLVLLSNTQFVTFAAARLWQQEFGVPYVFDLQDPWRTDHYRQMRRRPPGGWKYRFSQAIGWALEEFSFSAASAMISVSPAYIADARTRYPWSRRLPARTIGFGVSELDFRVATRRPAPAWKTTEPDRVHLVYTGAAGPIMPGALQILFGALARLRASRPADAARLCLHFIGTSYVAAGRGRASIEPLAMALGVGDLVREVPHRIGHLESLSIQAHADALLLLGSSDPAYSPSKLYPYFLSGRPILALIYADSTLEDVVDRIGGAFRAVIRKHDAGASAMTEVESFLLNASQRFAHADFPAREDEFFRAHYLVPPLAREQVAVFDCAIGCDAAAARGVI